jgi:hypothetical protein
MNWSRLLRSAILSLWYSCFEVTWPFYRRICTRFFILNKIFSQPRVKYFTNINQKCYFLLWLFQLRWTLIQHFQVFHVNKLKSGACENDQTYIFRFVKYVSTFFYTYLPVNIHFQLIIITSVSILTDPNVIFFYGYSNWGELSFNIFKFFM